MSDAFSIGQEGIDASPWDGEVSPAFQELMSRLAQQHLVEVARQGDFKSSLQNYSFCLFFYHLQCLSASAKMASPHFFESGHSSAGTMSPGDKSNAGSEVPGESARRRRRISALMSHLPMTTAS